MSEKNHGTMQTPETEVVMTAEQKKTRLEEIMSRYRKETGIPDKGEIAVASDTDISTLRVKSEVMTRGYDELSPEEQAKVAERLKGVDYLSAVDIQRFGSSKESAMTKHAEIIISKYTAQDVGEIADPIIDLVATLKTNNPRDVIKKSGLDVTKRDWGIFSKLRDMNAISNAKKRMARALAEHQSIKESIQDIQVELKKQQVSLQKDMQSYEEMGMATYGQIADFELDCIALQIMIEDAQAKLDAIKAKGEVDLIEMNQATMLKNAIERMQRKLYSIQSVRTATVQTIPQMGVLISGDEIICEKIEEIETLVIPLWSWQYAIAAGAIKQKEALAIQGRIRSITSDLLRGNAKLMHDNMIAAQNELYEAAVAVEDLAIVQEYLDDMISQVTQIRQEASKKTLAGMEKMQEIQSKNFALLGETVSN